MLPVSAFRPLFALVALAFLLAGCAHNIALNDHDCMTRVMYFESNRSSQEGMLAVGTTVMNRLGSPKYPKSVCEVVGQPHQFAPGVLDKPMNPREVALSSRMADRVLNGERHPQMPSDAMFFHTAGLSFPYRNMHYVLVAGGNAFYEKKYVPDPAAQNPAPAAFAEREAPVSFAPAPQDPDAAPGPPEGSPPGGEPPAEAVAQFGGEAPPEEP